MSQQAAIRRRREAVVRRNVPKYVAKTSKAAATALFGGKAKTAQKKK